MSWGRYKPRGLVVGYRTRGWKPRRRLEEVRDVEIRDREAVLVRWDGSKVKVRDIWYLEWT